VGCGRHPALFGLTMYPYRHVLFVCHANTSRSVMAEHLLVRLLSDHAVPSDAVLVTSGGIAPYARDGSLVSLDTRLVLRDVDIHLEPEAVARDLKRGHRHLLEQADLVITMTQEQVEMVRAQMGELAKPVLTLRDFAGLGGDIADPAGQDENVFTATRNRVAHALEHALPKLVPGAEGRDVASCAECAEERGAASAS
jgi:protein-tyrosine-phosphatase